MAEKISTSVLENCRSNLSKINENIKNLKQKFDGSILQTDSSAGNFDDVMIDNLEALCKKIEDKKDSIKTSIEAINNQNNVVSKLLSSNK